jgi:hypothetical protein
MPDRHEHTLAPVGLQLSTRDRMSLGNDLVVHLHRGMRIRVVQNTRAPEYPI